MNAYDESKRTATESFGKADPDDFWDISRLIPATARPTPPSPTPRARTEAVEMELDPPEPTETSPSTSVAAQKLTVNDATAAVGVTHFVPPHTPDEGRPETSPCDEYTPDGVLLHAVKVFDWPSGYHYFDQFIHDAARFAAMIGKEAPKEPFFSYFPQYVQMNRSQTAWYLWWREMARRGRYVDTDYAYVLLYMFELLNLPAAPGGEDARRTRDALAAVWMAYRRAYPRLDHYMCEWLCDYCLIHRLTIPVDILAPALDEIITAARLKEFYLSATISTRGGEDDLATARILLRHCCQYDYRKSKFASGEHKALFDRLIPATVAAVFPLLTGHNGQKPLVEMQDSTITRDAYTGALCAYRNKRRIEVAYTSFSRSHELRFLIGDMVKHTENRLRSRIGVRSRLSVMSLPIPLREAIDDYLFPRLPEGISLATATKKNAPRPDYEKLYDLPRKTVSVADADAIEQASWATTRILTEAFGEAPTLTAPEREEPTPAFPVSVPPMPVETVPATVPAAVTSPAPPTASPLAAVLGEDLLTFLRLCLDGDAVGQRAFCASHRQMPDALADEINTITAETEIYDVVLEDSGDGTFTVIDDYRDAIAEVTTAALKGE